ARRPRGVRGPGRQLLAWVSSSGGPRVDARVGKLYLRGRGGNRNARPTARADDHRGRWTPPLLLRGQLPDGAHLDASNSHRRDLRSPPDRGAEGLGIEGVEPPAVLLGFRRT